MKLIFTVFILILSQVANAEPYRRSVNFEWDVIEGAKAYEVNITPLDIPLDENNKDAPNTPKDFTFIVDNPIWNGRLSPGKYSMRLRSLDYRKVPGTWSAVSDFNVELDKVTLTYPPQKFELKSSEHQIQEVELAWNPVGGADKYTVEVFSEKSPTPIARETLSTTKFKINLPVSDVYTWKVFSFNDQGLKSEAISVAEFKILGKTLEPTKLAAPENEFVRKLNWEKVDSADHYELKLSQYDLATKKWTTVNQSQTKEPFYDFDASLSGGIYQLTVLPVGHLRPPGKAAKLNFKVHSGDRSPASEYRSLVRQSIDRVNGWYLIASYMLTDVTYKGSNAELNSQTQYTALGSTIRVGAGYMQSKTPWGLVMIAEMSGFNINKETRNYASLEVNGQYRKQIGDKGELRLFTGPYVKDIPETLANLLTNTNDYAVITTLGVHVAAEYWYSLNPKFGLQANFHAYTPIVGLDTPNGNNINNKLSTSFGFLGSYRYNKSLTLLAGYTRKIDSISYLARPGQGFAGPSDENTSEVKGNYVNAYIEWAF